MRRVLFVVLMLGGIFRPAAAQGGQMQPNPLPKGRACDMRFKLLDLRVENAAGMPVSGVTVTLRRAGETDVVRTGTTSETGFVTVADDAELRRLTPRGAAYVATLRKGTRTRRVSLRLAPDASGCHIAIASGSSVVTF